MVKRSRKGTAKERPQTSSTASRSKPRPRRQHGGPQGHHICFKARCQQKMYLLTNWKLVTAPGCNEILSSLNFSTHATFCSLCSQKHEEAILTFLPWIKPHPVSEMTGDWDLGPGPGSALWWTGPTTQGQLCPPQSFGAGQAEVASKPRSPAHHSSHLATLRLFIYLTCYFKWTHILKIDITSALS